jgi:hypothetical protein
MFCFERVKKSIWQKLKRDNIFFGYPADVLFIMFQDHVHVLGTFYF